MWSISGLACGQRKPHRGNGQKRSESKRGSKGRGSTWQGGGRGCAMTTLNAHLIRLVWWWGSLQIQLQRTRHTSHHIKNKLQLKCDFVIANEIETNHNQLGEINIWYIKNKLKSQSKSSKTHAWRTCRRPQFNQTCPDLAFYANPIDNALKWQSDVNPFPPSPLPRPPAGRYNEIINIKTELFSLRNNENISYYFL